MRNELTKFQALLRELFQFDCADLDFGLYRILNARRALFEDWIDNRLPAKVAVALSTGAVREDADRDARLQSLADTVREEFGADAIDGDGRLRDAIPGKSASEYRTLWQARHARNAHAAGTGLEAEIYNRLYDFFRRYYEDGDFLSLRRYGSADTYAVPYNGQEVMLHWANKDQYYIKTGEHFTDYRFRAGDKADAWHVDFKLRQAQGDRDNTKSGDKRLFFFDVAAAEVDADARVLTVPVAYRAATAAELEALGRDPQQGLNDAAEKKLLARPKLKAQPVLADALRHDVAMDDSKPQTLLARHLRRYTRRNSSDFFIHKDLSGFLTRELDYWLKAEVLALDALLSGGEHPARAWLQTLACLREVGGEIIGFLGQLEDFQKCLYEKRKVVISCNWCITLGQVERAGLLEELADILNRTDGGNAQKEEWERFFTLSEIQGGSGKSRLKRAIDANFLSIHQSLMMDSAYMPVDFIDRVLASFDEIDQTTDGVLVHGDNWQALNLLMERYREQAQCVYIDPPYNSKTSEIIYKNTYKHSSWLSMMEGRLALSNNLCSYDGSHIVAIDENEQEALGRLLDQRFPSHEKICAVVIHNKKGIQGDYFSHNHEYAYFCIGAGLPETHGAPLPENEWEYSNLRKWGRESERATAKNCFYPIFVENGVIVEFGDVCDENFHPNVSNIKKGSRLAVYPIDASGVERKWRYARGSVESIKRLLKVHATNTGEVQIHKAVDEKPIKTLWDDTRYIAGDYGTKWLTDLGLKLRQDLYPKSVHVVEDSIYAVTDRDRLIIDYFGGSGTTGHAVINLNRLHGGRAQFVMVEMGAYFDTVLLPRLKKITFTPEWKDGKPRRQIDAKEAERGPRIIKYLRLESYEDTLSNLILPDAASGQGALDLMGDAYRLGYWLDVETRGSPSLLNLQQLERPFDYTLSVHDGREARAVRVDVAETFNYLIGLIVQRRRVLDRDGRRYLLYLGRQRGNDARTAVLWRDIAGWDAADFDAERQWIAAQAPFDDASVIYVNGDSAIDGAQSLDPVFHARMFAPVH